MWRLAALNETWNYLKASFFSVFSSKVKNYFQQNFNIKIKF